MADGDLHQVDGRTAVEGVAAMVPRLCWAGVQTAPMPYRLLEGAEVYAYSGCPMGDSLPPQAEPAPALPCRIRSQLRSLSIPDWHVAIGSASALMACCRTQHSVPHAGLQGGAVAWRQHQLQAGRVHLGQGEKAVFDMDRCP